MPTKITFSNSTWSNTFYPDSMFHLTARVRKKAIEIGNSLMCEKDTDEAIREAIAIIRAKEWALGMGYKMELKEKKPRRRTGELHFRRKGKKMIPDYLQ